MKTLYLQSETEYYGKLELVDFINVEGTPVRADNFYVTYRLILDSEETEGVFSDKHMIHNNLLFITSMDIERNASGEGRLCATELHAFNLHTGQRKTLSRLTDGFVEVKSAENNVVIYTKRRKGSSAIHEFEQSIEHLWRKNQRLVSVSCPCSGLEPMAVFRHGLGQERFYWADGRSGITYVGLGVAADLQAWGAERFRAMTEQVRALYADAHFEAVSDDPAPPFAEPQLFGGFAFSSDFTPDNTWSIYHPAQFILPHYQVAFKQGEAGQQTVWLTLNTLVDIDEDATSVAGHLRLALNENRQILSSKMRGNAGFHLNRGSQEALEAQAAELQGITPAEGENRRSLDSIKYPMLLDQWTQMLGAALDEFEAERLQKVVLSRVCEIRFDDSVDVDGALAFLNEHYPDCTRFVFEPRAHHAFFGASPETLVQLEGRALTTMGLAGSAPRGKTPEEDAAFGQGLLDSAKDQHEHAVVVDAIRRRLEPICAELALPDEPELLTLSNIQHLFTPMRGRLAEEQTVFDLVELLHPTPALGGAPRADALTFIDAHEPVPRGWYAAPVGIVNRDLAGTFCVAIRSAVAEYERVWLHAGAGIVAGSDPQMEWDETALKFRPILNALGVQGLDAD